MLSDKELNMVRGMGFVFGVLISQQNEPYCSKCMSFAKTAESAKDKFLLLEKSVKQQEMPEEIRKVFLNVYDALSNLNIPDNPIRQKMAGNCKLQEGTCFPKNALAFFEKIAG